MNHGTDRFTVREGWLNKNHLEIISMTHRPVANRPGNPIGDSRTLFAVFAVVSVVTLLTVVARDRIQPIGPAVPAAVDSRQQGATAATGDGGARTSIEAIDVSTTFAALRFEESVTGKCTPPAGLDQWVRSHDVRAGLFDFGAYPLISPPMIYWTVYLHECTGVAIPDVDALREYVVYTYGRPDGLFNATPGDNGLNGDLVGTIYMFYVSEYLREDPGWAELNRRLVDGAVDMLSLRNADLLDFSRIALINIVIQGGRLGDLPAPALRSSSDWLIQFAEGAESPWSPFDLWLSVAAAQSLYEHGYVARETMQGIENESRGLIQRFFSQPAIVDDQSTYFGKSVTILSEVCRLYEWESECDPLAEHWFAERRGKVGWYRQAG